MKVCPKCGQPVAIMSVRGPTTADLNPCGHTVPPDAVEERETTVVVDSETRTITVPDGPLPERLAAIQRQINERDVVTTADVQAIEDEISPLMKDLAEAVRPLVDAVNQVAKDLAEAFSAIDLGVDDSDDQDSDDSRLPASIREARERRERQREENEANLGDARYS